MHQTQAEIRGIIRQDLKRQFVKSVSIAAAWQYQKLFEEIDDDPTLPTFMKNEEFAKSRGMAIVRALIQACRSHNLPYDFKRLECNGQKKFIMKCGRVVIIQEPMLTLTDCPRASDYKRALASSHGLIRQLELDLGDVPYQMHDWDGTVLAALLHGTSGTGFSERDKQLGGLLLAVPDASYSHWVARLDLTDVALFGTDAVTGEETHNEEGADRGRVDMVDVSLRRKERKVE